LNSDYSDGLLDFQEAVINHIIFAGVFLVTRLRCRVILEQTTVIRFVSPLKRELDLDLIFPIKDSRRLRS